MKQFRVPTLVAIAALTTISQSFADSKKMTLTLAAVGPTSGSIGRSGQSGQVTIEVDGGQTTLTALFTGLAPRAVYSLWQGFDLTQPPFLAKDTTMAIDDQTGTVAPVFPFTPAAADNAGFVAGIGLDPNGFQTDDQGNSQFQVKLNYDIFQAQSAPVLLRPGATQTIPVSSASGVCAAASGDSSSASWVDTAFMRVYDKSGAMSSDGVTPSFQVADGLLKPRLVRGHVAGLTLAEHLDGMTHGHVPGVIVGSPTPGCGDWVPRLSAPLANATQ